ncbi:MAG TPA: serine hydrolase, partial [Sphingomicrobium sp.]
LEERELKAYRASRFAATAIFLTVIGWVVMISVMFGDLNYLSASFLPVVLTLQVISFVAFIGGAAAILWYAATVWRRKGGWRATWKAKAWSALLVVSALTILWVALTYHLIGFATNY